MQFVYIYIVARGRTSRLVASGIPGFATCDVRVCCVYGIPRGLQKHGCSLRGTTLVGQVGCRVGGSKALRSGVNMVVAHCILMYV